LEKSGGGEISHKGGRSGGGGTAYRVLVNTERGRAQEGSLAGEGVRGNRISSIVLWKTGE